MKSVISSPDVSGKERKSQTVVRASAKTPWVKRMYDTVARKSSLRLKFAFASSMPLFSSSVPSAYGKVGTTVSDLQSRQPKRGLPYSSSKSDAERLGGACVSQD
jgi:hypothetical protein